MIIGNHFFIDFREVEIGHQLGKILVASIDVREQLIVLTKGRKPTQAIDEKFMSVCYDDSTGDEVISVDYKAKGQRIRHTYDDFRPLRKSSENKKTLSNTQKERMSRVAIRSFIGKL